MRASRLAALVTIWAKRKFGGRRLLDGLMGDEGHVLQPLLLGRAVKNMAAIRLTVLCF